MKLISSVRWYKNKETAPIELTDWKSIKVRQTLDSNTNDTTLELLNTKAGADEMQYNDDGDLVGAYVNTDSVTLKFNSDRANDILKVYAAYVDTNRAIDTTSDSEDLLTTAEVREIKIKATNEEFPIELVCEDQTYTILGRVFAYNFTTTISGTLTGAAGMTVTDGSATFPTDHNGLRGRIIRIESVDYLIASNTATQITLYDTPSGVGGTETYEIFWTAPAMVQALVRHATDSENVENAFDKDGAEVINGDFRVDARFELLDTANGGGFIEVKRFGGTNFPAIKYSNYMKPIYEFIEEISQTENTNSQTEIDADTYVARRKYRFRIDERNRFLWFYPGNSATSLLASDITAASTTITISSADMGNFQSSGRIQIDKELIDYTAKTTDSFTGCTRGVNNTTAAAHSSGATVFSDYNIIVGDSSTGFTVLNASLTKKVFDVVNHVIFRVGNDMNNSAIVDHYFHRESTLGVLRTVEKPYEDVAKKLKQDELDYATKLGKTSLTKSTDTAGTTVSGDVYEYPADYNDFYPADAASKLPHWDPGASIASDTAFNSSFRVAAVKEGTNKAVALCSQRAKARWAGNIDLVGVKILPGEMIVFTDTRHGLKRVPLRVKGVNHNITKNGWVTTLDVEEDDAERGA